MEEVSVVEDIFQAMLAEMKAVGLRIQAKDM